MQEAIIGWHHTKFGKLEGETVETLVNQAVAGALEDSEMDAKDIDAVYIGFYNNGFSNQDFISSLVMQNQPDLRFKPSTRVENACATGSAAVFQARKHIQSGQAKRILVVGVEKMTDTPGPKIGELLLKASYLSEESHIEGGFAGVFAQIARNYFAKYGDQSEAMAKIAAKNHANGCLNPYAQMHKDFGFEFCNEISDKNPIVVDPLRRTDCSLVSDGAAALVMTDTDTAAQAKRAVGFKATVQVNDFLPMSKRDIVAFEGPSQAWSKALNQAGLSINDLSCVETHDCFTIAELMQYEAMGLTEKGQGAQAVHEGWVMRDGKLPVNLSGGLKAKGHPIGATGVSMHVLSAKQLCGEAGDMQINDPQYAGVFNMGGAAVANYCSILKKLS